MVNGENMERCLPKVTPRVQHIQEVTKDPTLTSAKVRVHSSTFRKRLGNDESHCRAKQTLRIDYSSLNWLDVPLKCDKHGKKHFFTALYVVLEQIQTRKNCLKQFANRQGQTETTTLDFQAPTTNLAKTCKTGASSTTTKQTNLQWVQKNQ